MTEIDPFEERLEAAVRSFADRASTAVDPVAVAWQVAGPVSRPRLGFRGLRAPWQGSSTAGAVTGTGSTARSGAVPRVAWILLAAALAIALAAAGVFVGSRLLDSRVALTPTGIETLPGQGLRFDTAVADGKGALWAAGAGAVTRYEPSTRVLRTWTVGDDAAFEFWGAAASPARDGGVWLWSAEAIRRFDGTGFRDIIAPPGEISSLVEAPDGTLWVLTGDGGIFRRDGSRREGSAWASVPGPSIPLDRFPAGSQALGYFTDSVTPILLTVDRAGAPWVASTAFSGPLGGAISRYDGTSWVTYTFPEVRAFGTDPYLAPNSTRTGVPQGVLVADDGSLWVATTSGLARFDGTHWVDIEPPVEGASTTSIAVGPDGAVWVGATTVALDSPGPAFIAAFDGVKWKTFLPGQNLPFPSADWATYSLVSTGDGVYASTGDSLLQLRDGRWEAVAPAAAHGPAGADDILAISRDELWTAGDGALWHYQDGAWAVEKTGLSDGGVAGVEQGPNGTLWAFGQMGMAGSIDDAVQVDGKWVLPRASIAVRQDGRWSLVGESPGVPTTALAFGLDGTGLATGEVFRRLRFDGSRWVADTLGGLGGGSGSLAIARDGAVWVYGGGDWFTPSTLYRIVLDKQEEMHPLLGSASGDEQVGARDIAAASNGDVWVALDRGWGSATGDGRPETVARFDGTSWTLYDDLPNASSLALAQDGTVWAATDDGIGRFDGANWSLVQRGHAFSKVAVAPDGTVFAVGPSGIARIAAP